jgi:hypothetical protein
LLRRGPTTRQDGIVVHIGPLRLQAWLERQWWHLRHIEVQLSTNLFNGIMLHRANFRHHSGTPGF